MHRPHRCYRVRLYRMGLTLDRKSPALQQVCLFVFYMCYVVVCAIGVVCLFLFLFFCFCLFVFCLGAGEMFVVSFIVFEALLLLLFYCLFLLFSCVCRLFCIFRISNASAASVLSCSSVSYGFGAR